MSDKPGMNRRRSDGDGDKINYHPYHHPSRPASARTPFEESGVDMLSKGNGPTKGRIPSSRGAPGGSSSTATSPANTAMYSEPGPSWAFPATSMYSSDMSRGRGNVHNNTTSAARENSDKNNFKVPQSPKRVSGLTASDRIRPVDQETHPHRGTITQKNGENIAYRTSSQLRQTYQETTTSASGNLRTRNKDIELRQSYQETITSASESLESRNTDTEFRQIYQETTTSASGSLRTRNTDTELRQTYEETTTSASGSLRSRNEDTEGYTSQQASDTEVAYATDASMGQDEFMRAQKNASSATEKDESADIFGSLLASHLKKLTGLERIKAEKKIFDCLDDVRSKSSRIDDEIDEPKEYVNLSSPTQSTSSESSQKDDEHSPPPSPLPPPPPQQEQPLFDQQTWSDENVDYESEEYPTESYFPQDEMNWANGANWGNGVNWTDGANWGNRANEANGANWASEAFAQFMEQLQSQPSPGTSSMQYTPRPYLSANLQRTIVTDIRLPNPEEMQAHWNQAWNAMLRPRGPLVPAPRIFTLRPGFTPVYDMNGRLYHTDKRKIIPGNWDAVNFDVKC